VRYVAAVLRRRREDELWEMMLNSVDAESVTGQALQATRGGVIVSAGGGAAGRSEGMVGSLTWRLE
jgi:hypothetical protein